MTVLAFMTMRLQSRKDESSILTDIISVNILLALGHSPAQEHAMNPTVQGFFDPATWTVSYVVYDKPGSACAIIDSTTPNRGAHAPRRQTS